MDEGRNTINESLQKRARANRLPSLQPVRDLTLGNISKRTFIPNVNAKKTKDSTPSKPETKKEPREPKRRREPRPPREKKFQPKAYVQSYSIFADGPAAASNLGRNEKPAYNLGGSSSKNEKGNQGIRLGGISHAASYVKKEEGGLTSPKKEKKHLEGFIADIEEGDMIPIVYPRKVISTPRLPPSEKFMKEVNNQEYEELGLIQFINPMPVEPTSSGIDPSNEGTETVDFTRLPEGEFAKLQILDNGEVRLVIGDKDATVKVMNGTQVDHLMELVRIRTIEGEEEDQMDEEDVLVRQQNGEMHVLGRIENRYVCAVDFDSVFQEMSLEQEIKGHDSDSDLDDR